MQKVRVPKHLHIRGDPVTTAYFRLVLNFFKNQCDGQAQSAWDNHFLASNFAKYSPILNFQWHSPINLSLFGYSQWNMYMQY